MSTQTAEWPEGVIAHYLTIVGEALRDPSIAVDVMEERSAVPDDEGYRAICSACGESEFYDYGRTVEAMRRPQVFPAEAERLARTWAQCHAEKCRAMPRPTGGAR